VSQVRVIQVVPEPDIWVVSIEQAEAGEDTLQPARMLVVTKGEMAETDIYSLGITRVMLGVEQAVLFAHTVV
jgi:hypothetical protein